MGKIGALPLRMQDEDGGGGLTSSRQLSARPPLANITTPPLSPSHATLASAQHACAKRGGPMYFFLREKREKMLLLFAETAFGLI